MYLYIRVPNLKKIIEHDSEEKANETFQMACDGYVNKLKKRLKGICKPIN